MPRGRDRSVNVVDGELPRPLVALSTPLVRTQLLQVGHKPHGLGDRISTDAVAAVSLADRAVEDGAVEDATTRTARSD